MERFHRLIRAPADAQMVITPSDPLLDEIERLGSDPRRPRTAIARWVSKTWLEKTHDSIRENPAPTLDAAHHEKEIMERPQHYPPSWGLDLIPFPNDLDDGWELDRLSTACYTSLTTPRPFDPSLHGLDSSQTVGFLYSYLSDSGYPDKYDFVNRRGGGARGGFAMTTGATEGAYPTSILPQPTFNLGRLGFSDGGWNPEGLQWTNRPKRMSLTGLRNGWAHKVMFARSRTIMHRNLYGRISRDEATPRAPNVVVNGTYNLQGVLGIQLKQTMNSPAQVSIDINNVAGRRSGTIREGDVIQVFASPRHWANPPLVFTGFVAEVIESDTALEILATDSLGYLSREILDTSPPYYQSDSATVIKDIIANSAYSPPIGRIINESFVILPANMDFAGQSRLKAIQAILSVINSTPNIVSLRADKHGFLVMERLRDVDDASVVPLVAGGFLAPMSPKISMRPVWNAHRAILNSSMWSRSRTTQEASPCPFQRSVPPDTQYALLSVWCVRHSSQTSIKPEWLENRCLHRRVRPRLAGTLKASPNDLTSLLVMWLSSHPRRLACRVATVSLM